MAIITKEGLIRAYRLSMKRYGYGSIEQQNKRIKARARILRLIPKA